MADSQKDDRAALRERVAGLREHSSEKLGQLWWAFLVRGCLAGVLAVLLLIWPSWSVAVLVTIVGLFAVIDGVTGCVAAWRASERGPHLGQALLVLALGLILLLWPGVTVSTLLVLLGLVAIVTGVGIVLNARPTVLGDDEGTLMRNVGIGVAVIGLLLTLWPTTGVVTVAWLLAAVLFALAALFIVLARRFKRLRHRLDRAAA